MTPRLRYGRCSGTELLAAIAAEDEAYARLDQSRSDSVLSDDDEYEAHQRTRRAALDPMGQP